MEAALGRSGHGGVVVKEEKRVESNGDEEIVAKVGNGRKEQHEDDNLKTSSPKPTDLIRSKEVESNLKASSSTPKDQDDQLKSAKAKMGEVREENQRLRMYLDRIMKDYRTLQMQFNDIAQQEAKKSTITSNTRQEIEEPEFVSLSLGRNSSDQKKDAQNKTSSKGKEDEQIKEGLALGLDCKFEGSKSVPSEPLSNPTPENSFEEPKEEARDTWPPSKILKTMRSGEDEALQQNPTKKARVSVRARCDTPTMNDGCQWRKYGQKISKGNPCPRAYYRCTMAPTCPVRKQVQRCAEDITILITTYEGTHNHPLPIAATAMASTTSAAASMLMSGSSTSRPGLGPSAAATTSVTDLHGLNFFLSDNSNSKQFYLPTSSISNSPSCPTITLDLTTSTSSSSSSHFSRLSSSYPPNPIFSTTSLNFNSSESNALPMSWGNSFLSYGTQQYNKNDIGSFNLGRQNYENLYQSYMQKNNPAPPQQSLPHETSIAAATKAITSDPSFQSALAAALSSIIGAGGGANGNQGGGENFGQKFKWGTGPTHSDS